MDRDISADDDPPGAASATDDLQPGSSGAANEAPNEDVIEEVADGPGAAGRLARDTKLVERLRRTGFQGLEYDEFEGELVRYGWAVLDAWLKSGTIFARCAGIGRAVNPNERERERLIQSREDREDLVSIVVGDALDKFRENALVGGGWDGRRGGATLATYFVGRVVREFPNHFRSWQTSNRSWDTDAEHAAREREAHTDDPAGVLVQRAVVLEALRRLDPREREIVTLHYEGFSHTAIAQFTGAVSAKAVEGVLSRWRKRERKVLAGGEHHG